MPRHADTSHGSFDIETRDRLLAASARLFADHGFERVTVRDICAAAGANIAAVNYHFPGKAGLYDEVVRLAIAGMQKTAADAKQGAVTENAEQRLRLYVRGTLSPGPGNDHSWIHALVVRELSSPTSALERVIDGVVRPRLACLEGIVAELLGCPESDPRVARGAFSVHAQCLALLNTEVAGRLYPASSSPDAEDAMVDHITEFCLAGLWAMARTG